MPLPPAPDLLQHLIGRVAQGLRPDDAISRHYARLMGDFGRHALMRWVATSQVGLGCRLVLVQGGMRHACPHPAAGACIACGHPVCLDHAFASPQDGNLICRACVQRVGPAAAGAQPPPSAAPPAADDPERLRALAQLDLRPGATPAEIKRRFRELSKDYHPDTLRGLPEEEREAREARYRQITAAYTYLTQTEEAAA